MKVFIAFLPLLIYWAPSALIKCLTWVRGWFPKCTNNKHWKTHAYAMLANLDIITAKIAHLIRRIVFTDRIKIIKKIIVKRQRHNALHHNHLFLPPNLPLLHWNLHHSHQLIPNLLSRKLKIVFQNMFWI